ncbi:hypothetical protein JVU11DRAFT_10350 [Chiua virens]|nr:hypothetical protein JVU11DRAFT_10350 [Chiua virens]
MDNLMSAVLTLGSPTLAAYSLYLTLLNARWVNDRLFSDIHYPSVAVRRSVIRVLTSLQQVPLRVHPGEDAQFESLVIHPDNDEWWIVFAEELEYSHTWSIASATNIIWVVIAYLLTVANSMSNIAENINSNGQGTGSGWLWLLPVVVGWLMLSPKCDYKRVLDAYDKANRRAFVADSHDPMAIPAHVTSNFGLTITPSPDWEPRPNIISPDESRIPPIFNYARVWLWAQNVYVTSLFYRTAFEQSNRRIGVDGQRIPGSVRNDVPRDSRLGARDQVVQYCHPGNHEYPGSRVLWPRGIFYNTIVASLMALQLQWGTTSAAVLVVWFTPTIGLGCRSLAYLLYGALSTTVWISMVLSSLFGYYAHHLLNGPPTSEVESAGTRPPHIPFSQPKATSADSVTDDDPGLPAVADNTAIPLRDIRAPQNHTAVPDPGGPASIFSNKRARATQLRARTLACLADWLRWFGKTLAILNAIGTIANSLFQYAGVYDTCFCDSSVYTWGSRAFSICAPSLSDVKLAENAWIGALALALSSCGVFVGSIYLMRDSLPK